MKRWLALRRWWIAGITVALVCIRVAAAAGLDALGLRHMDAATAVSAVLTACDLLCLALAAVAVVAFVQYGRIFNARVPTE